MRDEHDPDSAARQAVHEGEQKVHLGSSQGGGGLVHQQNPRVLGNGLDDLDHFLDVHGEAAHQRRGIDIQPEPLQQGAGFGTLPAAVDEGKQPPGGLLVQKHVLRDREGRDQVAFLVDRDDPPGNRIPGSREPDRRPFHEQVPAVAREDPGDDFHERALPCPVLPNESLDDAREHIEVHTGEGLHALEGL